MSINIQELTERKVAEQFPNIIICNPNETVPVLVRTLEEGDVQLIIEFKGKKKSVMSISLSAFNIDKILRTCGEVTYRKTEEESYQIKSIKDYLSCV